MNPADTTRYEASKQGAAEVTSKYRLGPITENILRNLSRVTSLPHRGVSFSGTVVVCGAGPSLNHAIPVLKERAGKVPIIAVNTAAPALAAAGVEIDVLVLIESLDLSAQIKNAGKVGTVVLDLAAHPNAFEAAKEIGARVGWILEGNPITFPLAYALGVEPHQSGGFALSAALELARVGGASEIVLCGADLGYPTGEAYAKGAGWSGLDVKREGDRLAFTGREDRDAVHQAQGVPALPRNRPFFDVPAWGGEGTIPTVVEFAEQRDWIAEWHVRTALPHQCEVLNVSWGGARIPGVSESSARERINVAQWCGVYPEHGATADVAAAGSLLLAQCDSARTVCKHILEQTPWPNPIAMAAPMGFPLALSTRERTEIKELVEAGALSGIDGLVTSHQALKAAADRVEALLKGEA